MAIFSSSVRPDILRMFLKEYIILAWRLAASVARITLPLKVFVSNSTSGI